MRAEHLMRLHWREVVSGLVVTEHNVLQTTIRKSPPSSDLHFFHLIYSSASKPTTLPCSLPSHPPLHRKPAPVCRHTFGIMLHVQANCAAKGIISVHCRRPVNQSSLCYRQRALPSHPTHTRIPHLLLHPRCLLPLCPLTVCLQGRELYASPAHLLFAWPSWSHWAAAAPRGLHWPASATQQCET